MPVATPGIRLFVLVLAVVAEACASSQPQPGTAPADDARRVILIIGDGTGLAQWSAAVLADDAPLAVSRLPEIGLVDTRCVCSKTTDSGASGTSYGIGMRTGYTMIGMGPDSVPHTSVLEAAEARGMATGMVTTTHITDATPAAFGAHVASRYERFAIAEQYAEKDIEVLLGGGKDFFARRPDGRDLIGELRERYTVVTTPEDFAEIDIARTDRLLGLFADSTIFPDASLRPSMPDMARAALAILDRDPDGFFLLLESEDTDDLGHSNVPIDSLVGGMRALDSMIAVALAYQEQHPGTLIVVTGDHETGGLSLQVEPEGGVAGEYATGGHSASMVPIFAGGPGAAAFGTWLRNEEVGRLLMRAVGAPQP
ncbi:MAG: alkaline phosphatase [Longimicrobiales bacterium]